MKENKENKEKNEDLITNIIYNFCEIIKIDKKCILDSNKLILCILCFLSIFSVLLTIIWKLIF